MIGSKNIVAYLRLSIEDGDDGESQSITNQRKIIEKYANDNGFEVSKFYVDDGYSGYKMNRPSFDLLKHDLNEGNVDTIVVKDLSRLGRHNAKVQLFLENILESDKRIIAINDNYDTYKEETHTMACFQTVMNEMYVKDISKKIRSSMETLKREGRLLCRVPYGYYKDKNKCYVDSYTAKHVQQIFDLYINGMGVKKIAKTLTENNVITPIMAVKRMQEANGETSKIKNVTDWEPSTIIRILENEFYIGTLVLNKTKLRSIKGKRILLPKDEYFRFENHHEAIIDKNTFYIAQEMIKRRVCDHFRGQKCKTKKNLFSGMIRCADCGAPLIASGGSSTVTRYICKTYNTFGTSRCSSHVLFEHDILEVLFDLLKDCRNNLNDVLEDIDKIIQAELKRRNAQHGKQYDLDELLDNAKKSLEALINMKTKELIKNPSLTDIIDKTYGNMIDEKYHEIQSLEKQILDQKDLAINETKIKHDANIAITMIDEILTSKNITRKQILTLVDKMVVYEDSGLDIFLKGNLHELSCNYFKINETTANKIRLYAYEFIATHKDRFTKDACVLYIKDKGVKTHYRVVSDIINNEIGDMIELLSTRRGYKLIRPIEDIERALLRNVRHSPAIFNNIAGVTTRIRNNNVKFDTLISISNWISHDHSTVKRLF